MASARARRAAAAGGWNDRSQHPRAGLHALRGAALCRGLRGRPRGAAGPGALAALAGGLHAVAVDLLHGLDVLRRGGLCRALGAGIRHHLSRADAGDDRLVVDAAPPGAGGAQPAHHLDRRPHFVALRQIQPAGGAGDGARGDRHHALYRAAAAIGDAVVLGLRRVRRAGTACRAAGGHAVHRAVGGGGAGGIHDPVRHPQPRRQRAPSRRGHGHRHGGGGQALRAAGGGDFRGLGAGGGRGPTLDRIETSEIARFEVSGGRWVGLTMLSAMAFLCLPRMFQVMVVENEDEDHLRTAAWAFPGYLMLMSLFVLPIAAVGLEVMPAGTNPDLFVLTLPLMEGRDGLAILSFLGGFSSATSMVIVAAIALSTMVSNHIVMPVWLWSSGNSAMVSGDVS